MDYGFYDYLGSARNVGELVKILSKVGQSATFTLASLDEEWSYVEVYYDKSTNDIKLV
jgi:hypothetical protein